MIRTLLPDFKHWIQTAGGLTLLLALTSVFALPPSVSKELKAVGIPASSVAVVVQEVGAAQPLLAARATAAVNPASLMKLVTTYAALELLGPAYRWRTEASLDGEHLVLRGQGDPKLNYESFWMLLRALRGRGLSEIRGDLVLDRSWLGPVADSRIDDDSFRPYNVPPDALLVNFKSVRFNFLPQYERNFVQVFAEPALPGLQIVNELKIVERGCPEGRAFRDLVGASFQSRPPRAAFTGVYPAACGERDLNVALHDPEDYVGAMVRQLWTEMGGSWAGTVRQGTASAAARLLYTHESEPLSQIVRDINKFSNNVMARQLYLTIGAEAAGAPALPEKSAAAIHAWLAAKRLRVPELALDNGSGLSRTERISGRRAGRDPAVGVAKPGNAGNGRLAAGDGDRRNDAQAAARLARGGAGAYQDRLAVRRPLDRRLRARKARPALRGRDDREPPESTRCAGCAGCAGRVGAGRPRAHARLD